MQVVSPVINLLLVVVKQKLAETSELIRSKLEALSVEAECLAQLSNNSNVPGASLEETMIKLRELGICTNQHMLPGHYYNNRLVAPMTPEQQQQIVLHQQTELQQHFPHVNYPVSASGIQAVPVRTARRNIALSKNDSTGRRGNSASSSAPPPPTEHSQANSCGDQHISSYVDLQTEANSDTALTVACVGGHETLVNLFLQKGANVEHRDKKGFTPLILAATGGHVDVCRQLIQAGCVTDAQSERTKDTALSLACSGGRREVSVYTTFLK